MWYNGNLTPRFVPFKDLGTRQSRKDLGQ